MTLYNESQMDWKFFSRDKFKYTNEKESLKITCSYFFPSLTLTGFTNSLLLGAQSKIIKFLFWKKIDGVLMKFNNNKSHNGDFEFFSKYNQGLNKPISTM